MIPIMTHFRLTDTRGVKVKGREKLLYASEKQKGNGSYTHI